MRLYDTHCHFVVADALQISTVLTRAKNAGVEKLLAVGGAVSINECARLVSECRNNMVVAPEIRLAMGYDREQVGRSHNIADIPKSVVLSAWGEIGLDYHYAPGTRKEQMKLFSEQLEEARRRNLPVVVHTRESDEDTLSLLREIPSRGIIHCYTGTVQYAKQFLDLGFYISISGIVTFRPARNVRVVAQAIPSDRILIETDSPFLAPEPVRGITNEPALIRYTCEFLARLRGMDVEEFAELTFANAERILG